LLKQEEKIIMKKNKAKNVFENPREVHIVLIPHSEQHQKDKKK